VYAQFYGLTGRPFQLTPDSRFFYESRGHAKAMAHLTYGLHQAEGFIIVTGDVGAGKTTLVERLCANLDPERYVAAKMLTPQTSADDTLRMAAAGFGIYAEGLTKADLIQRLERLLGDNHRAGKRSLLLVDEAQHLTIQAIEELRMLSNFAIDHTTPLQCFLLGQPQFRAILGNPGLEQLRQRVLASYHLGPLGEGETRAYIEHRLGLVGWRGDPSFTDAAFHEIFSATGGLPREINSLCSRLLLYGFLEETHHIDETVVGQVAEEWKAEFIDPLAIVEEPKSVSDSELRQLGERVARLEERMNEQSQGIGRALEILLARIGGNPS
jgi:putative secretion ATPase (PEP-CTERM system associated)